MRAAVNGTVSTVFCSLQGPLVTRDLAATFPRATKLQVDMESAAEVTPADARLFLEYIPATSPALVENVVALGLDLGSAAPSEEIMWWLQVSLPGTFRVDRCAHLPCHSRICTANACKAWSVRSSVQQSRD
jgi:hypothetical protein